MSDSNSVSQDGPRSDLQVVARVAALLNLFGPDQQTLRMSQVASELKLRPTTVHRYLNSLEHHGFLKRVNGVSYELGPLIDQLGVLSSTRWRLMEAAAPVMEELALEIRQTVVLSIWNGSEPVITRTAEDVTQSVHISVRLGSSLPPDSAQGIVFLAGLRGTPAYVRSRRNLSSESREKLDAGLASFDRDGLVSSEAVVLGVRSIAVPVRGESGAVEAAIAVVGPYGTVPSEPTSAVARALIDVGQRLSVLISGTTSQPSIEPPQE